MKKVYLLLLASVIFITPLFSQKKSNVSTEKNVLKVNSLALIIGTGSVFYEHKISDKMSGQLGVAYLNYTVNSTNFSGLIITPETRFYLKKRAIDGVYFAPYLRFQEFDLSVDKDNAKFLTVGGGAVFGRQWITNSGFVMDLFLGGNYNRGTISGSSNDEKFDVSSFEGFGIRVGFSIGLAF